MQHPPHPGPVPLQRHPRRPSPLTVHSQFRVPLEGTALSLGILSVFVGSVLVWFLSLAGFTADSAPISFRVGVLFEPRGLLFTFWGWAPPTNVALTLVLELALWSIVGVAISHTVIRRVAEDEPTRVRGALDYAARNLFKSTGFVGVIVTVLLVLTTPLVLPSIIGMIPNVGETLSTWLYVLMSPLIFLCVLMGISACLAGFPVGYLFIPAAIGADEGKFLDCVSRAIGYAFARPFLFVWDAFKIALFSYAVYYIGSTILPLVVREVPTLFGLLPAEAHPEHHSSVVQGLQSLIIYVIRILTGGFVVAYVFGASTLMYLNLRLEVDNVGLDLARSQGHDDDAGDAEEHRPATAD